MVNQKRIALFVDIDNMPLNKKHVDNIITQLEKSGEIVYAKIYGVTDRRHREIICDAVARGFETVPPVYPTRRGSTKVFDIRILVDLCELFATNKSIDGVAIVANPAHQVYLFSRLKRNGIKIFACDNLDEDSAKFVDEILSFGYNDPNSVSKAKKEKPVADISGEMPISADDKPEETFVVNDVAQEAENEVEQPVVQDQEEPVVEQDVVAETTQQPADEQSEEQQVEQEVAMVQEPVAEEQLAEEKTDDVVLVEETVVEQPEVVEQPQDEQEVVEEQPEVLAENPEQEEIVVDEIEPIEEEKDDNLDILRQIQQIKQDVPNNADEEDEALIEKIKQLLDEFN